MEVIVLHPKKKKNGAVYILSSLREGLGSEVKAALQIQINAPPINK